MNSRSRTRSALAALATLAVVGPVALGVTHASAAPRSVVEYDALGDSYASGYGVPPYEACGRSQASYAVQVDGRMRIDLDAFDPGAFHPNTEGYRAYTAALTAAINPSRLKEAA
jgi:hypothetical protein